MRALVTPKYFFGYAAENYFPRHVISIRQTLSYKKSQKFPTSRFCDKTEVIRLKLVV